MANAVATAKQTAVSGEVFDEMFEDGPEGAIFDASELQIPFLRIAQQMSPEINKKDAKYIEGLSAGDIFNTLTGQVYPGDDGLLVIPCYIKTSYKEWVPRDMGGGFVQEFSSDAHELRQVVREEVGGKLVDRLPSGNELVTSDDHYCLVIAEDGTSEPVLLDMKSTQRKVAKRWRTMISMNRMKNPKTGKQHILPCYSTLWRLKTVDENNKRNETYSNYAISKDSVLSGDQRDMYEEAKMFRQSVDAGEVRASEGNSAPPPPPQKDNRDNDIPF
jgi:hypothetical protein|tara:strand:+ start:5974 stop:6795 length:822 start_codon:yes stop_codon:yes gene_type:complete